MKSFQPHLLNLGTQVDMLYSFFRQMTETSNANLIRIADHVLASSTEKER